MAFVDPVSQTNRCFLTWEEIDRQIERIRDTLPTPIHVWGVPKNGTIIAARMSRFSGVELLNAPPFGDALSNNLNVVILDDVVDSGVTMQRWVDRLKDSPTPRYFRALYSKPTSPDPRSFHSEVISGWIVFPWEYDEAPAEDAARRLIEVAGEDPRREGLMETPRRMISALGELTRGYNEDPREILGKVFTEKCDQMVIVKDIPFWSLCEHHMLPFHGMAHVGYVPNGKVVGLSKIPRLVECFARRLQIQERLTSEIASAIDDVLNPIGVGVVITAQHTCMAMRGVRSNGKMVTSAMYGCFRDAGEAREEFLRLTDAHRSN